jgi:hypothetical protein
MDYLEGKIEKYEKEQILNFTAKLNFEKNICSLQEKIKLIKEDRDTKE